MVKEEVETRRRGGREGYAEGETLFWMLNLACGRDARATVGVRGWEGDL